MNRNLRYAAQRKKQRFKALPEDLMSVKREASKMGITKRTSLLMNYE
jgi:hypothetical protein